MQVVKNRHGIDKSHISFHFRLIIAVFIAVGLYGTITLSLDAIDRFNTNPTVISMDRNMFFWNTSFPSLTICPHKKLSEIKLAKYME